MLEKWCKTHKSKLFALFVNAGLKMLIYRAADFKPAFQQAYLPI